LEHWREILRAAQRGNQTVWKLVEKKEQSVEQKVEKMGWNSVDWSGGQSVDWKDRLECY
jgi:TRAP-type C4-dicarboxylate transport system substrate-binding protein